MTDTTKDWALCVGIGSYTASSRLDALPGALNDAVALFKWIVDPVGGAVPEAHAELIISPEKQDEDAPDPAAHSIESFLRARYRAAEASRKRGDGFKAGRRLWLYFSGHGIGFPDDGNDTGLLSADASPPFRDFPHIAGMAWAELFRVTKAFDEVVLLMDCCRLETTRTALRQPAVREIVADPQGKMMAAFAVSPSKAAYEEESPPHGAPRGRFTVALEELLINPPRTPMSAREFLDHLELRAPEFDPFPPRSASHDFELLPARGEEGPSAESPLLIAHGESTSDLAASLARTLGTRTHKAQVMWASSVLTESNPDAFHSVQELIVTRDVSYNLLRDLVEQVQPRRTVVICQNAPEFADLPNVRFVPSPDQNVASLSEQVTQLAAALVEPPGFLKVSTEERVAKIRVWNTDGQSIASEFGVLKKFKLLPGAYQIRGAIGSRYVEKTAIVNSGETTSVALPPIPLRLPCPAALMQLETIQTEVDERRAVYKGEIGGTPLFFSAPSISGWRLEAFSHFRDRASDFSIRLVPNSHPLGAPHEMDSTRESLKLALSERSWDAGILTVEDVASDPICALLAAALKLKSGESHDDITDAAADLLGEDDVDIKLLRGAATADSPPLLSLLWHSRLKQDELSVAPNSTADQIVGRLQFTEPWLTWTAETNALKGSWLSQVANATWPGWNNAPDAELALSSIDSVAKSLGAPIGSIKRRTYKSPRIDWLVQHQEIAFVGASSDQLPAALAVAFVERGQKKWKRLDVWSLVDDLLRQVQSDDRTPDLLVTARNRAEQQMLQLLEVVAEQWSVNRYSGVKIQYDTAAGTPISCFASLWDWSEKGGRVHVSPNKEGQDVRTTEFENLIWREEAPPPIYSAAVAAYQGLIPAKLIGSSQLGLP